MIDKIVENGEEKKFRTLKKDNKVMKETIFNYQNSIKLL